MAREYDAMEEVLIQDAASDALEMLNAVHDGSAVTKFIRSGDDLFRLRLEIVQPLDVTKEPLDEVAQG